MSSAVDGTERRDPSGARFSYVCHRCLKCCHDKLIQVNPYEAARLARRLGISTTKFLAEHLEDGVYLRRVENGACSFLGPQGCTVHPDRPLVCRLYPLGRHVSAGGEVRYSHHPPHPESLGVYGESGTIEEFLRQQEVGAFISAADRYLGVLQRLYDAWRKAPTSSETADSDVDLETATADLLDFDRGVAAYCQAHGRDEPVDLEERLNLHLEALAASVETPREQSNL